MEKQLLDAIQLAKEAKETGLNDIYMKTYSFVYETVFETVEAENLWEVVQEVYITMFQSMETLKYPEDFYDWLHDIIDQVTDGLPRSKNINGGFVWEDAPISKKEAIKSYEMICEKLGLEHSSEPYVEPVPLTKAEHMKYFVSVSGLLAIAGTVAYIANSL
ncbi:MAG: hypothetical protein Q4F05_01535 [bacterium]|nr:hypothetical protein [bacterium]